MDFTWLNALLVGAGCLAFGYFIGSKYPLRLIISATIAKRGSVVEGKEGMKKNPKEPLEIERLADLLDDFKMVLVVRNDLKMGKGKIAAQCSHATLGLYKKLLHRAPKALNRWEMCAQPKVVVKIESEEDMLVLQAMMNLKRKSTDGFNIGNILLDFSGGIFNCGQMVVQSIDQGRSSKTLIYRLYNHLSVVEYASRKIKQNVTNAEPERAKSLKLPTHITIDAGRTQIAPNSRTVMAIMGPVDVVDDVTGGLKLL